ncbi:hypothetical protein D3C76_950160 [compost metagenome]
MPKGITAGTQLAFHLRPGGARAEGGQQALLVEIEQAVHVRQRHGQHRPRGRWRVDVSGHRGAATVRNQAQVLVVGERQQLADLLDTLRERHRIRVGPQRAFTQRQPVRQTLATRMQQTIMGLQAVQRMRRQARGRHPRQCRLQRGVGQRGPGAYPGSEKPCALGRQFDHRGCIPPAVPASHACVLLWFLSGNSSGAYSSQPPEPVTVTSGQLE